MQQRHRRRVQLSRSAGSRELAPITVPDQTIQRSGPTRAAARQIGGQQRTVTSQYERSRRRARRPPEIMQAVRNLDVCQDTSYRAELMAWIQQAYAERMGGVLVGLFGRCYLGHPYVDHCMSLAGNILEHYTPSDQIDPLYREARTLARSPSYEYIEVYSDGELVPVREDGSAS